MAHTVASMLSSGERPRLSDFLLRWGKPKRQTPAEMLAVFKALASPRKDD